MYADILNTAFYEFDVAVYNLICGMQSEFMNVIMKFFTFFGGIEFVVPAGVFALILCFFKKTRRYGAAVLTSILLAALVVNVTLKPLVARPRPYVGLVDTDFWQTYLGYYEFAGRPVESDMSFPSGHTNSACAIFFGLLPAMWREKKKWAYWLAPMPFMVAMSRIYLAVHYPSDVLGGFIVGTICAMVGGFLGVWIAERINRASEPRHVSLRKEWEKQAKKEAKKTT